MAIGGNDARARNLILVGGSICTLVSALWWLFYMSQGAWYLSAVIALAMCAGGAMVILALRNRLRAAAIIMAHALILAVTLSALADAPTQGVPRSIHMNMLPVALATYFLLYREGFYLRVVLPVVSLLIFLAFALELPVLSRFEFEAASGHHVVGVWINYLTAVVGGAVVVMLMQSSFSARRTLVADLRRAIARGEFELHFQPQADKKGEIFGVEALLRWTHSDRGAVPPHEFIPLAEEEGLIIPIGDWVLRTACAQLAEWERSAGTAHLTIAVNVSAVQFRQPDFVEQVKSIVKLSGARPSGLKLELTETALAEDVTIVVEKMEALRAFGIRWSLDDFGTGYSSLSSLKRFPFDQIKIDQSFVRDLLFDKRNMAIVDTIIRLARSLNMSIIAEGVETEEQLVALTHAGCDTYQGYLLSPPLPVEDLSAMVTSTAHLEAASA